MAEKTNSPFDKIKNRGSNRTKKPTAPSIYYLLVGFLGGSLPWILPGIYNVFQYGTIRGGFFDFTQCGAPIGLLTGILVGSIGKGFEQLFGAFVIRLEQKYNNPVNKWVKYLVIIFCLLLTLVISVFISSPILIVFWGLDAF
jgi:hypothetical protein